MKKPKLFFLLFMLCTLTFGIGYNTYNASNGNNNPPSELLNSPQNVNTDDIKTNGSNKAFDFSQLKFTPWDEKAASSKVQTQQKKPYTIMIYMNGSDLESENGAATDDIIEMLESGVNADYVNIILFTGGTNRWHNDVIPENSCALWKIENGEIYELTRVGLVNMGDPGTLASFINFSINNFPAEKYGLVMWDHGGGSIAGYGHDEKFNESNLTLLDMNYAFEQSALAQNKLAFLGFDSCLMATVEMSVIASEYANYLVASEDVEPGGGWDYSFLAMLNENPNIDGAELAMGIVDYFMAYYGNNSDQILTMSVIDLSKAQNVMDSIGGLMKQCSNGLINDRVPFFNALARKRNGTKTFGAGSPRDNECDMVDIGDMASKLSDLFPGETANIQKALENCIIYNRHNSNTQLNGMSVYYIYGGKALGNASMQTYESLSMNDAYTQYLNNFYSMLMADYSAKRYRTSGQADSEDNIDSSEELISTALTLWQPAKGVQGKYVMTGIQEDIDTSSEESISAGLNNPWPMIHENNACLYKIGSSSNSTFYAVPSVLNGADCDIIVLVNEEYPQGKILGTRKEDGLIIQKGYDMIEKGDTISFYYQQRPFGINRVSDDSKWLKSDEFTVDEELKVEWSRITQGEYYYSLRLTDVRNNVSFTELELIAQ